MKAKIKISFYCSKMLLATLKTILFVLIVTGSYFLTTRIIGATKSPEGYMLTLIMSAIFLHFLENNKTTGGKEDESND